MYGLDDGAALLRVQQHVVLYEIVDLQNGAMVAEARPHAQL